MLANSFRWQAAHGSGSALSSSSSSDQSVKPKPTKQYFVNADLPQDTPFERRYKSELAVMPQTLLCRCQKIMLFLLSLCPPSYMGFAQKWFMRWPREAAVPLLRSDVIR